MAATTRAMPPTSAKAWRPAQRSPMIALIASIPLTCVGASRAWSTMRLADTAMQPACTIASPNSLGNVGSQSSLAKFSQPHAAAAPSAPRRRTALEAATKRWAMRAGATTSLESSCEARCKTDLWQADSPAAAAAKKPPSAPRPSTSEGSTDLTGPPSLAASPTGQASAAMSRAAASEAFTAKSLTFGWPSMLFKIPANNDGLISLFTAVSGSTAMLQRARMAASCTCGSPWWMAIRRCSWPKTRESSRLKAASE
mmetsp:Transcript_46097/g.130732  ORF Transcript_46097/g.130732 Transcript_46097/m.130732 type:complete len:255 (+) Transcript_46097:520-1284(+)